jgi:CHAT domain-containing protein/tetratricopeptide (TPR) repeat protein
MKRPCALLFCLYAFSLVIQAQSVGDTTARHVLDSIMRQSELALGRQDFEAAHLSAQAAIKHAAEYFGGSSRAYSNGLNMDAVVYYKEGRYTDAKLLLQQSLYILEQSDLRYSVEHASRLTNLGAVYKAVAMYDSAICVYKEAIGILERDTATMKVAYSNTLNNLANVYTDIGQYEEAGMYLERCLAIRAKHLGTTHEGYATTLDNLANLHKIQGHYSEAEQYYKQALLIMERRYSRKSREFARVLNNLGNLYKVTDALEDAESALTEALQIRTELLGKHHPDYARGLSSLAALYTETGRHEKALGAYNEALEIQQAIYGMEHPTTATTMHNRAVLMRILGRYPDAERDYLLALDIQGRTIGTHTTEYANTKRNLGFLYLLLGRTEASVQTLSETIALYAEILGSDGLECAKTKADLAAVFVQLEQYEMAEPLFDEALPVLREKLGIHNSDYYKRQQNHALLFVARQRYDAAIATILQTIEADPNIRQSGLDFAEMLVNLGNVHLKAGQYAKAENYLVEALDISQKHIYSTQPIYIYALQRLALLYRLMAKDSTSALLLKEVHQAEVTRMQLAAEYFSESEFSKYLMTTTGNNDFFYSTMHTCAAWRPVLAGGAYDKSLFYKNASLEFVLRRKYLASSEASQHLNQNLMECRRMLEKAMNIPVASRNMNQIKAWEARANDIERELVRTVAGYGELIRPVSWEEVKQQLRPNEAAVELVSYRYHDPHPTDSVMYAALILLPTDTAPRFIPLFEERQLQALLHRPNLGEEGTIKALYASDTKLLHLLWKPLEPLMQGVKTIYYAPSGLLHRINPAALRDADKRYLSEERQWVRMGSTRELVNGRLADRSFALDPYASPTAAVWGGIRYDMDSTAFAAVNPLDPAAEPRSVDQRKDGKFRYMAEEDTPVRSGGMRGPGSDGWSMLAGSALEAKQVDSLLHRAGFRSEVFSDYTACEERFKALGKRPTASPRILHVATHGFAYPDPKKQPQQDMVGEKSVYKLQDDPMLRSGLILAGANHYWSAKRPLQDREDGVLVAYEVCDLNLHNTELAVLSACQTGLGDVVGSEGVYGLQRAFRTAGARFLIVSLWEVPDEQTRELMRLFYENWVNRGASLRDAFNHAQETLRAQEPSPYLWAGFVLVE